MATRHASVGVLKIVRCYFSNFTDSGRRFSISRLVVLGVAPLILALGVVLRFDAPSIEVLGVIIAVYSVLLAVLVGTIPLAHSVIGQTNPDRQYALGERAYANNEIDRVQTLQDILASISYAAILLVVALVCCICLAFLLPLQQDDWVLRLSDTALAVASLLRLILIAIIYIGGISSFFTFFDMSVGVFDAMENHADTLKQRIRDNVGR